MPKLKLALGLLSVTMLSSFAITGSVCYLKTETPPITNEFYPGVVNIGIVEQSKDGGANLTNGLNLVLNNNSAVKKVWIKNMDTPGHNASAYIRVKLVAIWRNPDGTGSGLPADITYTMAPDDPSTPGKWIKTGTGADTIYYFTKPVAAGATTDQLLDSVTIKGNLPKNKNLEIEVLADAIQSDGEAAESTNTWGVNPESLQS